MSILNSFKYLQAQIPDLTAKLNGFTESQLEAKSLKARKDMNNANQFFLFFK